MNMQIAANIAISFKSWFSDLYSLSSESSRKVNSKGYLASASAITRSILPSVPLMSSEEILMTR